MSSIETGANGHAPGGVWLRLAVGEGLLYMGDHSPESRLYAFDVPPPTATMIIDGSYGDAEERLDSQRPVIANLAAQGPTLFPVPADGRAADIAIFLQAAGFDVAIDDAVRSVAKMLTQTARESARAEIMPALETLITNARPLGEDAQPQGVMVAHGGSGDAGVAGALIKSLEGRARTANRVHRPPGRRHHRPQAGRFRPRHLPALERASDAHRQPSPGGKRRSEAGHPAFGDPKHLPIWRQRVAPRELVSAPSITL